MGDWLEGESASRFLKEDPYALDEEFRQAATILRRVREAAGARQSVLLWGNHENHLLLPGRLPQALRGLCDPRKHPILGPELQRWKQKPYVNSESGAFWVGQVCFKHGYTLNDQREALQFVGPVPFCLVVGGHTHRPSEPTQVKWGKQPLYTWHANAGTWGPLHPDWAFQENCRDWGHAMVLGSARADGRGKMERLWEARTLWRTQHGLDGLGRRGRGNVR